MMFKHLIRIASLLQEASSEITGAAWKVLKGNLFSQTAITQTFETHRWLSLQLVPWTRHRDSEWWLGDSKLGTDGMSTRHMERRLTAVCTTFNQLSSSATVNTLQHHMYTQHTYQPICNIQHIYT